MRALTIAVIAALLIALLAGCGFTPSSSFDSETGAIVLSIDYTGAKAVFDPPELLDVDHYVITGTGPDPFGPITSAGGLEVFAKLRPGDYTITVDAMNANSFKIGEGSTVVTVLIGTSVPASIVCLETEGLGNVHSLVEWVPDIVALPVFVSTLKPYSGPDIPVTYVVDAPNLEAQATITDLNNGFYTMITQLFDDTVLSTGAACIVRVGAGQTTEHYVYLEANQATGSIELDVSNGIVGDLPLASNYADESQVVVMVGMPAVNITIGIDPADPDFGANTTIVWYMNGTQIAVDVGSIDMDATGKEVGGSYRLDAIVWLADGTRAGDWTWDVEVLGEDADDIEFSFDAPSAGAYKLEVRTPAQAKVAELVMTAVAGVNTFTIVDVPFGEHLLLLYRDNNADGALSAGDDYEYYSDTGGASNGTGATRITTPEVPTLYNFGTLDFSM